MLYAYLILRGACAGASETTGERIRAPLHQSISLKSLVILNMLLKLAEGVAGGRAFCATHKRHFEG